MILLDKFFISFPALPCTQNTYYPPSKSKPMSVVTSFFAFMSGLEAPRIGKFIKQ